MQPKTTAGKRPPGARSEARTSEVRVRRRVVVRGRVQGVWFRGTTQERARRAGVSGFARNRPDGSVEAVFEGPADAVAELLDYCGSGPPGARVDSVEVFEEETEGLQGFRVG